MLILSEKDVLAILDQDDQRVLDIVADAYVQHAAARTSVPHSVFLRFPDDEVNRIIGLPAFVGGERPVAGFKWVASFPGNVASGLPRASAVVVLNSMETGRAEALLEGTHISARRTGASAALAARSLAEPDTEQALLIGTGPIQLEILRYLRIALPSLRKLALYDLDPARAAAFGAQVGAAWPELTISVEPDLAVALRNNRLISLATTAIHPHLNLDDVRPGSVVLHISLRDLTPESILDSRNVVDDADHVSRANTSIHLAELRTGNRDFIAHSIGELLTAGGNHYDAGVVTVVSPFGLGALDMALGDAVRARAEQTGLGVRIDGFLS
ncbi:2,3-diaminopropionate biosynthesis protein SbnB [Pseudonocardiaceae bacterium YIM PH 21723]|nr:2,3-diaminopropionate biosynthesis protein SbnB [Pseudonocardiaceae bacterium YIM PH 21723]